MLRVGSTILGVATLAAQLTGGAPPYTMVATLPFRVDGQPLRAFAFDASRHRLYAGSNRGLFWVDLSEPTPRVKGPIIRKNILRIEFSPELSRMFYTTPDEVGYADLDHFGESRQLIDHIVPQDLVYEPTRREVYVSTRDPRLIVFDGASGRREDDVPLPGWYGVELESIPGRVFFSLGDRDGLYALDAATHHVAPWPVTGRVVTPARIEADPAGQYLFLSYYREIVAIDIASATVVGRVVTFSTPAIAFDPGDRLLIATWRNDPPPTKVMAYRVDAQGLTLAAELENPDVGASGVEPTSHGFVQAGNLRLLVWTSQPPPVKTRTSAAAR
jgi:hypothetical protein